MTIILYNILKYCEKLLREIILIALSNLRSAFSLKQKINMFKWQ